MTLTTSPTPPESTAPPTDGTARTSRVRAVAVAVGLTAAAFLASLVVGVAFVVPAVLIGLDIESAPVFTALTAVGQLVFLAVGLAYARRYGMPIRVARPTRRHLGLVAAGVVGALAVAVGGSLALAAFDLVPGSVIVDAATNDPAVLLGLAALSAVLIAPVEEFLFRGVIQGRLRAAFGPVGAVAGSSLLFGSMHLANYTGSLAGVVGGALLVATVGAVFGTLYERTRNLAVPAAVHALYNVILLGVAYLG